VNFLRDNPMTQFSIRWILSLNRLSQKWGQVHIASEDLPPELIKRLNLPRYERIGASLLGRLARDLAYKGKGVGELLLVDALKRSLAMSRQIASAAVVVDAKDEKAHKFYQDFGFIPFPESQKRLFLPMITIEQIYPETQ
jgi:predicted GNAT family N-acyltransferase